MDSDLIQQGYQMNVRPLVLPGQAGTRTLFELNQSNVILDTIKPAEDGSGDLVLRLYETMGTRTVTKLKTTLPIQYVYLTDMLEKVILPLEHTIDGIDLEFGPFQILTIRLFPGISPADSGKSTMK